MQRLCIARHGSAPSPIPTKWDLHQPLPAALNMAFRAGHVELEPLENLWNLYWHKGWVAPAKRPGE
jgi:hypothetical protein